MTLQILPDALTVCKLPSLDGFDPGLPFYCLTRTEDELSLVCRTADAPAHTTAREDGWRGFRVRGTLDFSLVGILARIAGCLAARDVSLFAVSTYDTDYVLVKQESFDRACSALRDAGYTLQ